VVDLNIHIAADLAWPRDNITFLMTEAFIGVTEKPVSSPAIDQTLDLFAILQLLWKTGL
jgi:hypothetical protein